MAEPLRHRQTKEAATDMFYLTPPRHISTLPIASLYKGRPASIDPVQVVSSRLKAGDPLRSPRKLGIGRASVYRALEG